MKVPCSVLKVLGLLALYGHVQAQNFVLTNGWSVSSGSQPYMTTGATERGLAYNPATSHLLLVSRAAGLPTNPAVMVLDPDNGNAITNLDVTGIFTSGPSITFSLNMIRCTSDGVIYACNLSSPNPITTTNNFIIYRWADETSAPTIAFQGSIGSVGMRFGDNLTLRGTGVNTTIMAGQVNNSTVTGKAIAFFTATDGTNFSVNLITNATAANGDFQKGMGFATGDAFYSKNTGIGTVKYSTFNLATTNASVVHSFTGFENNFGPMAVNSQSNLMAFIRYNSTASANQFVSLYTVPNDPSIAPTLLDTKYFPATTGNGNGVGSLDFGGGKLFALNTQNGLMGFDIVPTSVVNPPVITTQPASQTVYAGAPSVVFSVSVSGTAPFSYQWRQNGSDLPNATNASYSFSNITTNMAGSYSVVVSNSAATATSSDATLTVDVSFDTARMTNIWNLLPNSRFYLSDTDNAQRGLAFNPVTTNVLVLSRTPSNTVAVLDAATGTEKHLLNMDPNVITSGTTFPLNAIGVSDDGIVFAANLVNPPADSASSFRIYRWLTDSSNSVPELVFIGDPTGSNLRWGDTISVRGSGTNTQILLTPGSGNTVAILTTADGNLFAPTTVTVTDPETSAAAPSGFARLGNAFGSGNTFWAKASGALLRHVEFDLSSGAGSILHAYSFTNANTVPNIVTAIAVETNKNLLAGLAIETPDNVRLYNISDLENGPVLLDQELFSVKNSNGNLTGAAAFGDGKLFVLDSNNGIKAFAISTNTPIVPFRITTISLQSGPVAVFTWESVAGQNYQVQAKDALSDASWTDLGAVIATSTSTSFTNAVSNSTNRFYRIRAD